MTENDFGYLMVPILLGCCQGAKSMIDLVIFVVVVDEVIVCWALKPVPH